MEETGKNYRLENLDHLAERLSEWLELTSAETGFLSSIGGSLGELIMVRQEPYKPLCDIAEAVRYCANSKELLKYIDKRIDETRPSDLIDKIKSFKAYAEKRHTITGKYLPLRELKQAFDTAIADRVRHSGNYGISSRQSGKAGELAIDSSNK